MENSIAIFLRNKLIDLSLRNKNQFEQNNACGFADKFFHGKMSEFVIAGRFNCQRLFHSFLWLLHNGLSEEMEIITKEKSGIVQVSKWTRVANIMITLRVYFGANFPRRTFPANVKLESLLRFPYNFGTRLKIIKK